MAKEVKELGMTIGEEEIYYKIFSPNTKQAFINLYATNDANTPLASFPFHRQGDFWEIAISKRYLGNYYDFSIDAKITLDPYVKMVGVNGKRGYIGELEKTNPIGFSEEKFKPSRTPIIYELHVRDLTSDCALAIEEKLRGKFAGIKEGLKTPRGYSAGIDYLKELGVTHVHLLPVYDYASIDETTSQGFNWGYDPLNYNAIEGSYSTNPSDPLTRIREFKELIQRLHANNIGVIMDVVYNHTYNTDSVFEKTAPGYYYRMNGSSFSDGSGCGNETKSEAPMFRKFMLDSLAYYVKEYHIDGFRFDLMGLHDVETMNEIRSMLDNIYPDGSGKNILMYGEPWFCNKPGGDFVSADLKHVNLLNERIAVFNPVYRDGMRGRHFGGLKRGYATGDLKKLNMVKKSLMATNTYVKIKAPSQQVLYCSCHDDHSLFDHITLTTKNYETIINSNLLCAVTTLSGLGMAFFQAGEEFLRTKNLVKNSYNQSDYINKLDWQRREEYNEVVETYKTLIKLRKENENFSLDCPNPDMEMLAEETSVLAYRVGNLVYIINSTNAEFQLDLTKYEEVKTVLPSAELVIKEKKICVKPYNYWVGIIKLRKNNENFS